MIRNLSNMFTKGLKSTNYLPVCSSPSLQILYKQVFIIEKYCWLTLLTLDWVTDIKIPHNTMFLPSNDSTCKNNLTSSE